MSNTISNNDDIIDSRDVIARIEELESTVDDLREEFNSMPENEGVDFDNWVRNQAGFSSEEADELKALQALANECEGYGDWAYGEALIARSYWVEYVREFVSDIGDMPRNIPDYIVIDWEETANNIEADYMSVDYDGTEYLMRA